MELFSARKAKEKKAKEGIADVYQYDTASPKVRTQFIHILKDTFGEPYTYEMYDAIPNKKYPAVRDVLLREYGLFFLASEFDQPFEDLIQFVGSCSTDQFLDVVELSMSAASKWTRQLSNNTEKMSAKDAIHEINYRFREDGFGYQIANGVVIRLDSELFHAEVLKPTLALLQDKQFEKANKEFLLAHEHFRHGRKKDAIVAANRAFESAMKSVCDTKGWEYAEKARASDLAKVLKAHNFWPEYSVKSIDQLLSVLSSGLPEVRNNAGGHGEATSTPEIKEPVVQFALNLAAANILLLATTNNS